MVNKKLRAFFIGAPLFLSLIVFLMRNIKYTTGVPYLSHTIIITLSIAGFLPIIMSFVGKILKKEIISDGYNFSITGSLFFTIILIFESPTSIGGFTLFVPSLLAGLFFITAFSSLAVSSLSKLFPALNRDL